jgi:hypothetical protein
MNSQGTNSIAGRMIRACRLDVHIFEEVEADKSATRQALSVVVLVALATGIASLGTTTIGIGGLFVGVVVGIAGWGIWAWVVYLIGTKLLPSPGTHADWGQLARALGFAQSPGIFRVFGAVPVIGTIILLVVSVWMLFAMVVAVRQALDYTSTRRAVGVVLLSFIPYALLMSLAFAFLGG